jgi:hypothetical protein
VVDAIDCDKVKLASTDNKEEVELLGVLSLGDDFVSVKVCKLTDDEDIASEAKDLMTVLVGDDDGNSKADIVDIDFAVVVGIEVRDVSSDSFLVTVVSDILECDFKFFLVEETTE